MPQFYAIALYYCLGYSLDMKEKNRTRINPEKITAFLDVLEKQKSLNPVVLELPEENSFTDVMIVAGASSKRNAQGIADAIGRLCYENDYQILGIEGKDSADWILVDCNDIIIHILQEETRNSYKLEELWARTSRNKEQNK